MEGEGEDNKVPLIKQLKEAVQPHIPPDSSLAEWCDDEWYYINISTSNITIFQNYI